MAIADRVKDTSASVGTGNFVLSGSAPSGFQALSAIGTVGATFGYVIDGGAEWEVGAGTITAANTFSRAPSASSNTGGLVNFSAGTKTVFHDATAAVLTAGLIDPADVGFDVIGVCGQSNICGRDTLDTLIDVADPRVWQFGGWSGATAARYRKIFSGNDPLHHREGEATGKVGPGSWFGRVYASMVPSNRRVLLVPCGEGGTTLVAGSAWWASGSPGGPLYENAITQANLAIAAAVAKYPNSRYTGTIWIQGESDGDNTITQAAYAIALKALIAGFRARITGAASAPFIIGGMCPEVIASFAGYPAIRDAHIQVAAETNKCAYVPGPSGYKLDTYHYTAEGARVIGTNMALAVRAAQAYTAIDTTAPTASSAAVANATPTFVDIAMSEAMDTAITPAASSVTVSGHTVSALAWASSTVLRATVSAAFVNGEAARTVAYTQPGTNNARDLAASPNLLANFTGLAITNNIAAAASAVTMTGPSGGVASVASTNFTLGVSPVGGTITGTVVVTPSDGGAGGTFTPASKSLTSGTPSGTFTYTPASTGAKTISVTNNGGLSNPANITYTVAAAATAPATMVAPVATAGDTTASVALTAPSNGGSTITGYTVTSIPAGGVDANAGTTALTHNVTGLTNGTAYTFTATATNAVGTSAASPTSNSVTPSAAVASFATWNPADKNAAVALSNGNLTATGPTAASGNWCSFRSTVAKSAGKWYWEVKTDVANRSMLGVGDAAITLSQFPGQTANGWGYYYDGGIYNNANPAVIAGAIVALDVVGIALDLDSATKSVTFYKNGVAQGGARTLAAGTYFAMVAVRENGAPAPAITTNFGATAFAYTPPTGHVGLQ